MEISFLSFIEEFLTGLEPITEVVFIDDYLTGPKSNDLYLSEG